MVLGEGGPGSFLAGQLVTLVAVLVSHLIGSYTGRASSPSTVHELFEEPLVQVVPSTRTTTTTEPAIFVPQRGLNREELQEALSSLHSAVAKECADERDRLLFVFGVALVVLVFIAIIFKSLVKAAWSRKGVRVSVQEEAQAQLRELRLRRGH